MTSISKRPRKLRMAMIGGGQGAFIGEVHRMAAALCGDIELVAGAFSSKQEVAQRSGAGLFLDPQRVYSNFDTMLSQEALRPENERPDFITIVTPNHLHYPAATAALRAGFHVLCDKPVTATLAEARELAIQVKSSKLQFGLTHSYLGYPLVTQAKMMIAAGEFGRIRKVFVEYPQGWLADNQESSGNKQASWRTDPARSGKSGCIGDIGSHAHNLAEYVSGQEIIEVSSALNTFVTGRRLDDDGAALLRMSGGATGVLSASQVCTGSENSLKITIYGEKGGCEWHQQDPNNLCVRRAGHPVAIYRAGSDLTYLAPKVRASFRTPSGHPEGFIEAFANLYRAFSHTLWSSMGHEEEMATVPECPSIEEGLRGMEFIEAMVLSSKNNGKWTPLNKAL
ncbi:MAG: putative dehydrogenase [Flavobacteriales bacterium]|jgi:predicted dehydrogenase